MSSAAVTFVAPGLKVEIQTYEIKSREIICNVRFIEGKKSLNSICNGLILLGIVS